MKGVILRYFLDLCSEITVLIEKIQRIDFFCKILKGLSA